MLKRSLMLMTTLGMGVCVLATLSILLYHHREPDVALATPIPTPTAEPTPSPTPISNQLLLKNQGAYEEPLTGVGQATQNVNRPIAIMINNHKSAYPQSGLQQADIVYEVLAEGEITRFVAVYHSQRPPIIGPVRSIRPYYVKLGHALDAIMVHAGWSPDAMSLIQSLGVDHLDEVYGDGDSYWRTTDRKPPHNLYTNLDKIQNGINRRDFSMRWQPRGYTFAVSDELDAEKHTTQPITIPYFASYNVSYTYDEELHVYVRSMNGQPHLDRETKQPLTTSNVLVIESKHEIIDEIGRRDVDVEGPGKGLLLQQGKWRDVMWRMKDGLIRAYVNEVEVEMMRGTTWVQIVPIGTLSKIVK